MFIATSVRSSYDFIPGSRKSAIRLVSVLTLPNLVGRIVLIFVSRALATASSEPLSLKLSTC